MSSPKIDMGMDPVLSVSVASRTCFLVLSDGTCASPFHFIVPLTLKVPDDDLIKVFMSVVWNSCSCVNWNGMEWFGTSWIKAPLLKKIVPVGDTERLEILIGCYMFCKKRLTSFGLRFPKVSSSKIWLKEALQSLAWNVLSILSNTTK